MVRATGRMMRMNIDDGDIFIGEFANGALVLDPDELRHRRQLSGHRGARLRQQGRADLPAGRGERASARRSSARRRTRSSSASSRCRRGSIRRAAARASRGGRSSTPTSSAASSPRSSSDGPANEGNFERRRAGAGSDQRRRAVVPRAPLGVASARAMSGARRFFDSYYRAAPGERDVHRAFTTYDDRTAGLVAGGARRRCDRRDARASDVSWVSLIRRRASAAGSATIRSARRRARARVPRDPARRERERDTECAAIRRCGPAKRSFPSSRS